MKVIYILILTPDKRGTSQEINEAILKKLAINGGKQIIISGSPLWNSNTLNKYLNKKNKFLILLEYISVNKSNIEIKVHIVDDVKSVKKLIAEHPLINTYNLVLEMIKMEEN